MARPWHSDAAVTAPGVYGWGVVPAQLIAQTTGERVAHHVRRLGGLDVALPAVGTEGVVPAVDLPHARVREVVIHHLCGCHVLSVPRPGGIMLCLLWHGCHAVNANDAGPSNSAREGPVNTDVQPSHC